MKCYLGGARAPHEYQWVSACFANNAKEAKYLMWKHSDRLTEECDYEYIEARIIRGPQHDNLLNDDKTEPYIIHENKTLRKMGWIMEGDATCDHCGLAEFGEQWPVCETCQSCTDCGCPDSKCSTYEEV